MRHAVIIGSVLLAAAFVTVEFLTLGSLAAQPVPSVASPWTTVAKAAMPSVVNIASARLVRGRSPFAGDPFFRFFFDAPDVGPRRERNQGSGVIISALHGTMDALLPIARHGRPFRDAVVQAGRAGLHRYYEVQNGNHIERYSQSLGFSKLERLQPHAHRAFELIVEWVESGTAPPAGQCVPRGGTIVANPADAGRPERCAALLVE